MVEKKQKSKKKKVKDKSSRIINNQKVIVNVTRKRSPNVKSHYGGFNQMMQQFRNLFNTPPSINIPVKIVQIEKQQETLKDLGVTNGKAILIKREVIQTPKKSVNIDETNITSSPAKSRFFGIGNQLASPDIAFLQPSTPINFGYGER